MNLLKDKIRITELTIFLESLNIKSKRFREIINKKDELLIQYFNEALTHSSEDKFFNYEKLEFFGDAVLRLSASHFIDTNYSNLSVGKRSELRSFIVSDEWLTQLGKNIKIEQVILKGPKAMGDDHSKDTIIAESTEALIGAIYKCFNSIREVNIWLDHFWKHDADLFLKAPYKFNAKSALQEWCQSKGLNLPIYAIKEVSKNHGDPKRFSCTIFINDSEMAFCFGPSHKKAEKNAASLLIEKIYKEDKHL